MRFYNLPQYLTVTAPPNSLVDNLASTGIIGSLAFFFLVVVTMRAMNSLPRVYGTLGLVVLLAHYVDGLFDTFWIGALSITPFLIAGISLGMADADPGGERVPDLLAEAAASKRRPGHSIPRRVVARR
jgi:O-antigen ligase